MGHALFIAESFGGWDGDGMAGGQQAGEEGPRRDKCKIPPLRDKVSHLSSQVLDFAFGHPLKSLFCDLNRLLVGKA
jgi:hypothetical protein